MRSLTKPFNLAMALLLTGVISVSALSPMKAAAATASPGARVSFTFDDGLDSSATQAAPTLAKYGFSGTNYVITGCVGMTTAPNTCHANNDATYMTWDQIATLHNAYGWEIGSHTETHPLLASSDASDGQPNVLTPAQVTSELVNSKNTLAAHGYNATDIATPYGDYTFPVLAQIAKYYKSMRGFADTGYNPFPYQDYIVRDQQVQSGVTVATVKGYVDSAIANNQWLVLTFHDIKQKASTDPDDYEYNTADLDAIAAYIKSKNVPVLTVNDALASGTANLLAGSSFDKPFGTTGDTASWTTDNPNTVKIDGNNNGSYNTPANSVSFTSGTTDSHLFSPLVNVDPTQTYFIKSYLNMAAIGTGSRIGYYVDEYDANGNWVAGSPKVAEVSVWVENINFEYKPTNPATAKIRLQIINQASTGTQAYFDNVEMYAENSAITTTSAPITGSTVVGSNAATKTTTPTTPTTTPTTPTTPTTTPTTPTTTTTTPTTGTGTTGTTTGGSTTSTGTKTGTGTTTGTTTGSTGTKTTTPAKTTTKPTRNSVLNGILNAGTTTGSVTTIVNFPVAGTTTTTPSTKSSTKTSNSTAANKSSANNNKNVRLSSDKTMSGTVYLIAILTAVVAATGGLHIARFRRASK